MPIPLSLPLPSVLRRLWANGAGNVLPMAASSMVVLLALVGGGIDIARAYKAESRLQMACDSGVLAGRRAVGATGYDSTAQAQANAFFRTNFDDADQDASGTTFATTSLDKGNTIAGTARTRVKTVVMQMFGAAPFDLAVNCEASMGVGNSDVTLVLDTTGSMDSVLDGSTETRIQALRAAMKNFYATVSAATTGTNARIRYAFVPYSSSVNVGRLLYDRDPSFLLNSRAIQSRVPIYQTVTSKVQDGWAAPVYSNGSGVSPVTYGTGTSYSGTGYFTSWDCNGALPAAKPWTNSGTPTTTTTTTVGADGQQVTTTTVAQPQTTTTYGCVASGFRYYIMAYPASRTAYTYTYATSAPVYKTVESSKFAYFEYRQVTYDVSRYKTFASVSTNTGPDGSAQSSTWAGCIEERQTVPRSAFSWSSILGITPLGAYDLDIDSPPSSDATRWAPMWPDVAYYRTTVDNYLNGAATSRYGGQLGSFCPSRAQLLTQMSRGEFDAYADALVPSGATYHDIGMIWGARLSSPDGIFANNVNEQPNNGSEVARHIIFMTDGIMEPNYAVTSAYGIEFHDRRVTDDGYTAHADRHSSRFLAVCQATKAKGIRVWVIAFASVLTTTLQSCASDKSAFLASNAGELNRVFQDIAKQVGELRVIR